MTRFLIAAGAAAAIVLAAAHLGLTERLGAHPWWAVQIAWIGVPIGVVLAWFAAKRPSWTPSIASLVLAVGAFGLASLGKARFAVSYAEDVFAGQMWYWGWIGTALFTATTLSLLIRRVIPGDRAA